jgi:multidrug efflux pump subunit AcrB
LFDYGMNYVRLGLATVQGTTIPGPAGGKFRQIMVDLDPEAMYAKSVSATDVSNANSMIGVAQTVITLANAEDLPAHGEAMSARLENN